MINLCVNCSVITTALYVISAVTSGIYFGRLPIYTSLTGYILLPWLINHMFEKKSAVLVKIMMYGFYFLFFSAVDNIPQAANISSPLEARIVATTPRLFNRSRKASIDCISVLLRVTPGIA